MMKELPKQYASTQIYPLLAHMVRMGSIGIYYPYSLHKLSDNGQIVLLNDERSIFVKYLIFIDKKDNVFYSPHLELEVDLNEQERTAIIEDKTYHLVSIMAVKDFIEKADLHFLISNLRKQDGKENNTRSN